MDRQTKRYTKKVARLNGIYNDKKSSRYQDPKVKVELDKAKAKLATLRAHGRTQ